MQTTATPTAPGRCAPLAVPPDITGHLARFRLTLADLLTDSNPKMAKGADLARGAILHHLPARALAAAVTPGHRGATAPRSYLPLVAHLAQAEGLADAARLHNGCPWATLGCAAGCLNWAGHGGLSAAVASARGRRTLAMLADPATYGRAILWAACRQWAAAQAQGLPLALRLRGTDEGPACGWHRLRVRVTLAEALALGRRFGLAVTPGEAVTLAEALACGIEGGTLRLYDYSKAPVSGPLGLSAQRLAGWDITASLAADRATACADAVAALRSGFRLAVPVALARGQAHPVALAITAQGLPPLTVSARNGDTTDHRWADPHGVAVTLRTKLSRGAGAEAAGFSLRATAEPQPLADGQIALIW
jgi:hypothetical protein